MSGPVRLLWLIDSLTVGGAESLVVPFARGIDPRRYALTVCCLSTIGGNPIEQQLRNEGVPVVNLGARSLRDLGAFRRLARLVRDERMDLVHAHLTYSAIWSAFLARRGAVPAIASLHVAPSATRALQTTRRQILMFLLRDRLMRFVVNRWSSAVIMVSTALGDAYLAGGGLDPSKIRIVHNGIEMERFAGDRAVARARLGREFQIPPEAAVVATVSVLRAAKGIEVLLEAARHVPEAIFLLIGDGPKRQEWADLANRLTVSDRIRWTGYRRDVHELLPGCDLLAHPSLDDAFPTVLLEAMAAGLPIVASNVGGIPEIVEPGLTGLLVPPGDANALASAISRLLAGDTRHRMAEAARKTAQRRFTTPAWIARLTAVYDQVLGEANRR